MPKRKMSKRQRAFFGFVSPKLTANVSISSPVEFRSSIVKLQKNGLTVREHRALIIGQNRAKAQLRRRDLSMREREEFLRIALVRIPKPTKK